MQLELFSDQRVNPIDVVELFAGAGGMSLGAENVGLKGHGIEWNADAVSTRLANGLATTHGDVRDFGPADFPTATILAGGPPCQTFSVAGNGAGRRDLDTVLRVVDRLGAGEIIGRGEFTDDRTSLVLEPLRWALEALRTRRPYRAIVLEQVPSVLPVWDAYAGVLRSLGYGVATGVLKTEQYGLPQTRRRAVLVASLGTDDVTLPAPTHRPYRKGVARSEGVASLLPWVPMGDVVRKFTRFEVVSNYGTGGDPKNRGRRTDREPAFAVTGKASRNRVVAPDGTELPRFGPDTIGRLQGFPEGWKWAGNGLSQQVGNACPPPLAEALFTAATH